MIVFPHLLAIIPQIKTTLNNDDIVCYMLCRTIARETLAIWSDLLSTQIVVVSMELHLDLSIVWMLKKYKILQILHKITYKIYKVIQNKRHKNYIKLLAKVKFGNNCVRNILATCAKICVTISQTYKRLYFIWNRFLTINIGKIMTEGCKLFAKHRFCNNI